MRMAWFSKELELVRYTYGLGKFKTAFHLDRTEKLSVIRKNSLLNRVPV